MGARKHPTPPPVDGRKPEPPPAPPAKHTTGPWRWFNYPDGRKMLVAESRAVIHCPDAPITCDEADARLIAAAPDLLKGTRAAWHTIQSLLAVRDGIPDESLQATAAFLEQAIARAEGRS